MGRRRLKLGPRKARRKAGARPRCSETNLRNAFIQTDMFGNDRGDSTAIDVTSVVLRKVFCGWLCVIVICEGFEVVHGCQSETLPPKPYPT